MMKTSPAPNVCMTMKPQQWLTTTVFFTSLSFWLHSTLWWPWPTGTGMYTLMFSLPLYQNWYMTLLTRIWAHPNSFPMYVFWKAWLFSFCFFSAKTVLCHYSTFKLIRAFIFYPSYAWERGTLQSLLIIKKLRTLDKKVWDSRSLDNRCVILIDLLNTITNWSSRLFNYF